MDRKSRRCLNKRVNDAMDLIEAAGASGSIYEEELYNENIGDISIISSNSDNYASANSNILINDITPALEEYSSTISSTPHNETCTDKSFSDMDLSDEDINLPTQAVLSDFSTKLASWAIQDNISMESLGRLLVLLKSEPALSYLPKDARSLLKTPRNQNNDIKHIQPGKFFYFGIESQVCLLFVKHSLFPKKTLDIKLHINIDGLLYKEAGDVLESTCDEDRGRNKRKHMRKIAYSPEKTDDNLSTDNSISKESSQKGSRPKFSPSLPSQNIERRLKKMESAQIEFQRQVLKKLHLLNLKMDEMLEKNTTAGTLQQNTRMIEEEDKEEMDKLLKLLPLCNEKDLSMFEEYFQKTTIMAIDLQCNQRKSQNKSGNRRGHNESNKVSPS